MSLFLTSLLFLPVGAAESGENAQARVEPGVATPGNNLQLIFSLSPSELVEVTLDEQVKCTVTDPAGTTSQPCERSRSLVEVRLLESGRREFVFTYVAPSLLGNYSVHFEMETLLTLLPKSYSADAPFRVVSTEELPSATGQVPPGSSGPGGGTPGTPGNPGSPNGPGSPGSPNLGGSPASEGGNPFLGFAGDGWDAMRWFISSTVAAGVATMTLVARRWPFGS